MFAKETTPILFTKMLLYFLTVLQYCMLLKVDLFKQFWERKPIFFKYKNTVLFSYIFVSLKSQGWLKIYIGKVLHTYKMKLERTIFRFDGNVLLNVLLSRGFLSFSSVPSLKGQSSESDFLSFLYPIRHLGDHKLKLKRFLFWLRIRGDIHIR